MHKVISKMATFCEDYNTAPVGKKCLNVKKFNHKYYLKNIFNFGKK